MKKICTSIIFIGFSLCINAQTLQTCNTTCAQASSVIDNCAETNLSRISDFNNGILYYTPDACPDGLCAGAVWRFPSISGSGASGVNATVTIDALSNSELEKIDDDAATDINGAGKSSLFAPIIKPDVTLNGADRKGYVQFTVRFFLANIGDGYSLLLNLSNLSVYQYDLDGDNAGNANFGNNGSWFRETGSVKLKETDNPQIQFDPATEITATNYTDGTGQWLGGISSTCAKAGLTVCGQNTIAAKFSKPQYSVTFRLGYDYNAGGNMGQPSSQFGIKFGCFSIPGSVQLPVNLYDFTAKRNGTNVQLDWATTYEQMNQGFRIQRKTTGSDFEDISFVKSQASGGNSQIKLNYRFTDVNNFKGVSQYRIIQTDLENKIRVSEIRSVPGESAEHRGIVIYPNPASDGKITVLFENSSYREAVVTNVFGQQVRRLNNVTSNTISFEGLRPGIYNIRVTDKEIGEIQIGKFAVAK
jgi:hypothetical protein